MLQKSLLSLCCLLLFSAAAFAQGTYGTGHLPNKPPRLSEKANTKAIVVDIYPDNDLIKVKDEITNAVTTYKVSGNIEISGDKKEFGGKKLELKDVPKGRRIKIVYYKGVNNIALEIEILKEKK